MNTTANLFNGETAIDNSGPAILPVIDAPGDSELQKLPHKFILVFTDPSLDMIVTKEFTSKKSLMNFIVINRRYIKESSFKIFYGHELDVIYKAEIKLEIDGEEFSSIVDMEPDPFIKVTVEDTCKGFGGKVE